MVIVLEADELAEAFRSLCADLLADRWDAALATVTNRPGVCAQTVPGSATDIKNYKLHISFSPGAGGSST